MNKHYLLSQTKSTGNAYLFFLLFGVHYAYLGRWGLQILFWITFGGLGIWALIDLFTMSSKVNKHNAPIFKKVEEIEQQEKEAEHQRHMELMAAAAGNNRSL